MSDMNVNCKHKQVIKNPNEKIDFCRKCGCFLVIKYHEKSKEVEAYSILHRKMITSLDISPYETVNNIRLSVNSYNLSKNYDSLPKEYHTLRKTLLDYLKDYIVEYNFSSRSYFLGAFCLDYIFSKYSYDDMLIKLKPDLLALGVFLIAIKFIDDDAYPPTLETFTNKTNPSIFYPLNEVRRYEFTVAKLMDFKLDFFTSYYLTETILSHGVVFTYEIQKMGLNDAKSIKEMIKKLNRLALDINKMFIDDINSMKYSTLEIAATSILMTKELLKFETSWNEELSALYGVKSDDLNNCYNSILK